MARDQKMWALGGDTYGTKARRVWNPSGTKATVIVRFPDGRVAKLGGGRAHRAHWVVCTRTDSADPRNTTGLFGARGLRADLGSAESEARSIMNRSHYNGHSDAFVVPVEEVAK